MYFLDSCITLDVKDENPYYCHNMLFDTISINDTFTLREDNFNVISFKYHDPSKTLGYLEYQSQSNGELWYKPMVMLGPCYLTLSSKKNGIYNHETHIQGNF
jgi:hypothetical protein